MLHRNREPRSSSADEVISMNVGQVRLRQAAPSAKPINTVNRHDLIPRVFKAFIVHEHSVWRHNTSNTGVVRRASPTHANTVSNLDWGRDTFGRISLSCRTRRRTGGPGRRPDSLRVRDSACDSIGRNFFLPGRVTALELHAHTGVPRPFDDKGANGNAVIQNPYVFANAHAPRATRREHDCTTRNDKPNRIQPRHLN